MLLGKRTNVLLVRDEVGKSKPATRTLPKGDVAFGKANVAGESAGASKCIFSLQLISVDYGWGTFKSHIQTFRFASISNTLNFVSKIVI